jgi:uncharacterized cupredoxin-like copper-binding protein
VVWAAWACNCLLSQRSAKTFDLAQETPQEIAGFFMGVVRIENGSYFEYHLQQARTMNSTSFGKQHGIMLMKYAGISFISGAVNHGFFSGSRSLWTAAIGIVLFVAGAWLEHRASEEQHPHGLFQSLFMGTLLSIGLGFFTGGLQHFPDSPARSAWVVPLGFFISVFALSSTLQLRWQRALWVYTLGLGIVISGLSVVAYETFDHHPEWAAGGHSHGDTASPALEDHNEHAHITPTPAASPSMQALQVSRSIEVTLLDSMKFTPDSIQVSAGETIRFVVHNKGKLAHEMVLGNAQAIAAHAKEMQAMAATGNTSHQHGGRAGAIAVSVPAGEVREWVVKFDEAIELEIACLVPGHYEAGMKGKLNVQAAGAKAAEAVSTKPASPAVHDHSQHKH